MKESALLARYAADVDFGALPPKTVEMTKVSLLDAIGVSLAASGLCSQCKAFVEIALEESGRKDCTILGWGEQTSPQMAAFANGAMAHALDFEDTHDQALVHPNAAVVPAALAVAEAAGGVSGKELIAALAVGCDIVCRLGLAMTENQTRSGWYFPPILSAYGATAAAAKLMNLDETGMLDAFSLTLCQATCSAELKFSPHSDIRAIRDAFAAKAGVLSAKLANKGVKGFDYPFEGEAGFFRLFAGGAYDRSKLTDGLGARFEGENVGIKPWPACRGTHVYIEAALELAKENVIKPDNIAEIRAVVSAFNQMLCEPEEIKKAPRTTIDAKFSIPFTIAVALHHNKLDLQHFSIQGLQDEEVLALARKVRCETDPEWGPRDATRGLLEIKTRDQNIYSRRIDQAYGHPDRPLSLESITAKFTSCAAKARQKIPQENLAKLMETILSMEEVKDIRTMFEYLNGAT